MNCPKCGNPVASRKRYCDNCGTDVTAYRKIMRLSNAHYNSGLEKAKVRDLTGAAAALKKSLEMNKKNTDARNLLGLVYYEMGEAVAALSEWVISKHFQPDDNDADMYLEKVQDNPIELDNINQAIRKYNLALEAVHDNNDDLAVIQLKKVVSLHGNFIRALQLLSLILIKNGDYARARKYLERARSIDVGNTTTLRYLSEINREMPQEERGREVYRMTDSSEEGKSDDAGKGIAFKSSYREDKPNVMVFVNLLLGVLIGIAVVYYLIVPTIKSNIREEYDSQKVDYSAELSSKTATITQQEKKIASLQKKADDLQAELDGITVQTIEIQVGTEGYNALFDAWNGYNTLKNSEYSDDELVDFTMQLWELDESGITNETALKVLQDMRDEIYPLAARKVYKDGRDMFDAAKDNDNNAAQYEEAARKLKAAVEISPENDAAMYYLGKSYQALGNFEDAVYYYKLMLEVCPNSTLKEYIPQRLHECGADE